MNKEKTYDTFYELDATTEKADKFIIALTKRIEKMGLLKKRVKQ